MALAIDLPFHWATVVVYLVAIGLVLFRLRGRVLSQLVGGLLCFALVLGWWLTLKPSNVGRWQADVSRMAWASVSSTGRVAGAASGTARAAGGVGCLLLNLFFMDSLSLCFHQTYAVTDAFYASIRHARCSGWCLTGSDRAIYCDGLLVLTCDPRVEVGIGFKPRGLTNHGLSLR